MNPERINLRIAVACGWKMLEYPDWCTKLRNVTRWVNQQGEPDVAPNYRGDLNAMHEAVNNCLSALGYQAWCSTLRTSCGTNESMNATAIQRAEAFCRTVSCAKCGKSIWDCEQTNCKGGV